MLKNSLNLKIEEMKEIDVKQVFELEKELLNTSNMNTISSALSSETLKYYVLKSNEEVLGFLELSMIASECELYDIATKKEFQGNHLSDLLMAFMIEKCKDNKIETIFLEVNTINSKAINLYKKFGFQEYSIRKKYYGENDAVLMKKSLKSK